MENFPDPPTKVAKEGKQDIEWSVQSTTNPFDEEKYDGKVGETIKTITSATAEIEEYSALFNIGGRPIASATMLISDETTCIGKIYTEEGYREQGIGTAILEHLMKRLENNQVKKVYSAAQSEEGKQLAYSYGFEDTDELNTTHHQIYLTQNI